MAKMSDDELIAITNAEIRQAVGYTGGKLSEMRRKAEYYYLGLPEGDLSPPEVEGRSSVVVPYVRNVVESMLPQLMVKFTGSDTPVEFTATKPGEEQSADDCTQYLNYLFFKRNSGHAVAYTWMKDALLQKRGILKVWWDTRFEEKREDYKALDQIELAQLLDDEEVEPTAQTCYPDEEAEKQRDQALAQLSQQLSQAQQAAQMNQQAMQAAQQLIAHIEAVKAAPLPMLYDVTVKRVKRGGKLCVENVPPEEFLIDRRAKNSKEARFVGHRFLRTLSALRSMGYKNVDQLGSDENGTNLNAERIERAAFDDEYAAIGAEDQDGLDDSQREIWVTECYIRCDWDGDGIAELRKVTRAGNQLLDNEEVDEAPFVTICPIPLPHRFFGLSIYDLGAETQKTETSILRSQLDNMYLQVNGRYFVVENQVNLDDLLNSQPGGVVRIKTPGAVGRLDQAAGDSQAGMGMLEYMQQFGESATGWTRYSQGNDAKAIQGTATGANIVTNKDDMRLDLIARNFAEGWVELFLMMLKLVCQYQDKKQEIRLGLQWKQIDPRAWRNQFDLDVNVGLGVGSKDQKVAHLMAVIQQQEKVSALGVATPENIYNASAELAKLTGQKNGDKFFTDPAQVPPPPPPPNPEMIKAQAQTQIAQMNAQAQIQAKREELAAQAQFEAQKAALEERVAQATQQAQSIQMTQQQELDAALKREQAQADLLLEQQRMEHERQMEALRQAAETERADRANANKVLIAQIGAQQVPTPEMAQAEQKADIEAGPSNAAQLAATFAQSIAALIQSQQTAHQSLMDGLQRVFGDQANATRELIEVHKRPRTLVKNADGSKSAVLQ